MEEEKELEQTNEEEVEQEYDDTSNESTETIVEPQVAETQPPEKLFTQAQVDEMLKNREARARKKVEREYKDSISKYQELAYLTQAGLKTNSLDETLDKSREFYGKQGITYNPNNADDEIVGNYYAKEIINESDSLDDLEEQARNLSKKQKLSTREEIVLKGLNDEISNRKRITELKTIGVTEDEYNSQAFIDFEKKFTKDTPIKEVYNLYKLQNTTEKPVENPGSMKSTPGKEKRSYFSPNDVDKMTEKEIEENMDVIRESMYKW